MKKIGMILAGVLSLVLSPLACAELPTFLADELKKVGIPQENVAVYVQAVDATTPLISHNAKKSRIGSNFSIASAFEPRISLRASIAASIYPNCFMKPNRYQSSENIKRVPHD